MSTPTGRWLKALLIIPVMIVISLGSTFGVGGLAHAQVGNPPNDVVDLEALLVCNDPMLLQPIEPHTLPPPDITAKTACRLATKVIEVPAGAPEALTGRPTRQQQSGYAWATHVFSCAWTSSCSTSSPGFTEMYFNVSSQRPTLPGGYSWANYHFYNRAHISHPSHGSTCVPYASISAGIAHGNVLGVVHDNRIIAEYLVGSCWLFDSGVTVNGPGAITFHIYRSGSNWVIDVWLGYWANIAGIGTLWSVAAEAEYGQELLAVNGDLNTIVAPVNFMHKVLVSGTSNSLRNWSNYALVSPLTGKTQSLPGPSSPLIVMDLYGGDFSSMASHYIH